MVNNGWIGVDFDGTLVEYHGWSGWNVFGKPIPAMVDRIKKWIAEGKEVRIMTARVKPFNARTDVIKTETCLHTRARFSNRDMIDAIQTWTEKHVGKRLFVTCVKDVNMIELWDDRAVQVVPNTGRTLAEEHEAEVSALRGKVYGGAT